LTKEDFCGIVIGVDEMKPIEWKGVDIMDVAISNKNRRCRMIKWDKVVEHVVARKPITDAQLDAIEEWTTCIVGTMAKKELGVYKFNKLGDRVACVLTSSALDHGQGLCSALLGYENSRYDREIRNLNAYAKSFLKHYKAVNKLKTVVRKKYLKMSAKQLKEASYG